MALATDKSLFLHIPKTGGIWVRYAIKKLGIKFWEIGDQHAHFPKYGEKSRLLAFHDDEYYKEKYIFTFVRHPLSWYQSRWAFRMKHGWKPGLHPLDYNCASNDFRIFVKNVLNYSPRGWVTIEYLNYLDNTPKPIDFIGKTENLTKDLITALTLAGEDFDPEIIKQLPRANDSDLDGKSSSYWATYTEDLMRGVIAAESTIISRYYHDYVIDKDKWCRPSPY